MSIIIEHQSGRSLAEVRRISVYGLPGVGSYVLGIKLHLSVNKSETNSHLSNLSIRVSWDGEQRRMIGFGVPSMGQSIRLTQYNAEEKISFDLLLSPTQIEAIEALRNGGDISLSISLAGNISIDGKSQDGNNSTIPSNLEALLFESVTSHPLPRSPESSRKMAFGSPSR